MTKENLLTIEDLNLEQCLEAIDAALKAFTKDYRATTAAGKARARKASLTLDKLTKRYRKVTVGG